MSDSVTHIYHHPDAHGLGRHHAGQELSSRRANPELHDEWAIRLGLARTMDDLDLAHDTRVAHICTDVERNLELVEWTDSAGTTRRTSVTPEQFHEFFVPLGAD